MEKKGREAVALLPSTATAPFQSFTCKEYVPSVSTSRDAGGLSETPYAAGSHDLGPEGTDGQGRAKLT